MARAGRADQRLPVTLTDVQAHDLVIAAPDNRAITVTQVPTILEGMADPLAHRVRAGWQHRVAVLQRRDRSGEGQRAVGAPSADAGAPRPPQWRSPRLQPELTTPAGAVAYPERRPYPPFLKKPLTRGRHPLDGTAQNRSHFFIGFDRDATSVARNQPDPASHRKVVWRGGTCAEIGRGSRAASRRNETHRARDRAHRRRVVRR
jgi:hypothetical protein